MRVPVRNSSSAGTPWTRAEDSVLAQQHSDGLTYAEIAVLHRRTIGSIESRLKHLNLLPSPSKQTTTLLARSGSPWTADEDRRLIHSVHRFINAEATWQQVIEAHQRTPSALQQRVLRLGYLIESELADFQKRLAGVHQRSALPDSAITPASLEGRR